MGDGCQTFLLTSFCFVIFNFFLSFFRQTPTGTRQRARNACSPSVRANECSFAWILPHREGENPRCPSWERVPQALRLIRIPVSFALILFGDRVPRVSSVFSEEDQVGEINNQARFASLAPLKEQTTGREIRGERVGSRR